MIRKVRERLRSEGVRATAGLALRRLRNRAYLREQHVWYQCDLDEQRPRRELPPPVTLVRATLANVDAVGQLGQSVEEARERLEAGNDVWLALDRGEPVFVCAAFHHATPVMAASTGTLALPRGAACIEDSFTLAAARGRGIGPGAWTLICDQLEQAGYTAVVSKIETANTASRRAVEKVGFRPVAVMSHRRVARLRYTAVEPIGIGLGAELAARLL
ncbi:MAG: hypothetical protein QOH58_3004 [Thermoleophilaceae bacterium]|nr:hypothetical protein [Thermoleophilaceae bacterium]